MPANKQIRVGIIGCGVVAPFHARGYRALDNVTITHACDLVEEKAHALAEAFDIPHTTTDYTALLDTGDVDCVSVCTDHASHAPISVAALQKGKHVLCEKALAATRDGLDAMTGAHEQYPDLVFSGVFQHRFDAIYRYVKTLIEQNAFGTICTAVLQMQCLRTKEYYQGDKWRGTWEQEGGAVMINQAIHFVDILQWIMGGAEAVSATIANLTHGKVLEAEDTAVASLRFKSGALGTIAATSSSSEKWGHSIAIHGTDGSIEVGSGGLRTCAFTDDALNEQVKTHAASLQNGESGPEEKKYYGPSHPSQIADFIDAVRTGRPPFISARQARDAVDLVLGIYDSHRTAGWVTL